MKEPSEIFLQPNEAAIVFYADGTNVGYIAQEEFVEENSPTEKAAFVLWCLTKKEYLEEFRKELYDSKEISTKE